MERKNQITPLYNSKISDRSKSKLGSRNLAMNPTPTRHHRCFHPVAIPHTGKKIISSTLKSKSLVQLTTSSEIWAKKKMLTSKEQGDEPKTVLTLHTNCKISLINSKEEFKVARQVCTKLLLNAWRRRRTQVTALQSDKQRLENEVQNLKLQNFLLQHLFQAEKARVFEAIKDSAQLKDRLEKELTTTEILKKEVDSFKAEKSDWMNLQKQMVAEIETLKNKIHLEQERAHCSYLEMCTSAKAAIQRELEAHRKVSEVESLLKLKTNTLEEMKLNMNDFQARLSQIAHENKKLREGKEIRDNEINQFINEKNDEITDLKRTCNVYQNNIKNLYKDLDSAKEQIEGKEELINNLKGVVKMFEKEKEDIDKNLLRVGNKAAFNTIKMLAPLLCPNAPNYLI